LTLQTNELAKLFGRNIKTARVKRDINQERLCELADIDRSYLSRIENGNCKVALEKVYEIAAALECPLSEILPEVSGVKIN
jgi:transcriptional regulator with XRE-family HTH domain